MGATGQRAWVWENFTSGNNVAFMDPYLVVWPASYTLSGGPVVRNSPEGSTADPKIGVKPDSYWDVIRDAMGSALTYANRMNLVAMTPQPSLVQHPFLPGQSRRGIPGVSTLRSGTLP